MTVYIEKPAVNLREELASLRNQGGYEEQQFYFDGLVTNGTFSADTNWTKGAGWTISGGKLNGLSSGGLSSASQTISLVVGRSYVAKITIDASTGGDQIFNIGTSLTDQDITTTGTKTYAFVAKNASEVLQVRFTGAAAGGETATIDNVSVFETDGTDVVHRMPKGWVPLHVYEDGLLQREGAANDYTVVYDGFDYYVKPAVAPSATTQTCVIGVRK